MAFHLVEHSRRKLKGVKERGLNALWKSATKTCLIFDICYVALKIVTCVIRYTGYGSLVEKLLKFELIKAHLRSFSSTLGSYRIMKIILNVFTIFWARLGPFWLSAHLDWSELIQTHKSSCKLIWVHLGSFRLQVRLNSFERLQVHLI